VKLCCSVARPTDREGADADAIATDGSDRGDRFWGQVRGFSGRLKACRGRDRLAAELLNSRSKALYERESAARDRESKSSMVRRGRRFESVRGSAKARQIGAFCRRELARPPICGTHGAFMAPSGSERILQRVGNGPIRRPREASRAPSKPPFSSLVSSGWLQRSHVSSSCSCFPQASPESSGPSGGPTPALPAPRRIAGRRESARLAAWHKLD
jgi:hypothetical protein